jgi:hypothetical protein
MARVASSSLLANITSTASLPAVLQPPPSVHVTAQKVDPNFSKLFRVTASSQMLDSFIASIRQTDEATKSKAQHRAATAAPSHSLSSTGPLGSPSSSSSSASALKSPSRAPNRRGDSDAIAPALSFAPSSSSSSSSASAYGSGSESDAKAAERMQAAQFELSQFVEASRASQVCAGRRIEDDCKIVAMKSFVFAPINAFTLIMGPCLIGISPLGSLC